MKELAEVRETLYSAIATYRKLAAKALYKNDPRIAEEKEARRVIRALLPRYRVLIAAVTDCSPAGILRELDGV